MIFSIELLYQLILGHAVSDFALQSHHNNRMKNRHNPEGKDIWFQALIAHSLVNGAAVYLVTGSMSLSIAETVAHACIDFGRCEKWYGGAIDQTLHIGCKVVWCILA